MKNKAVSPGIKPGGGAQQGQDEKKDHERHPEGRSQDSDFEDLQANQSKGWRKHIPDPNPHDPVSSGELRKANPPKSNTVSGGNRPKRSPRGVDYN